MDRYNDSIEQQAPPGEADAQADRDDQEPKKAKGYFMTANALYNVRVGDTMFRNPFGLDPFVRDLFGCLNRHAGNSRWTYINEDTIAAEMGCSRRTVTGLLPVLQHKNLVKVRQRSGKSGLKNEYYVPTVAEVGALAREAAREARRVAAGRECAPGSHSLSTSCAFIVSPVRSKDDVNGGRHRTKDDPASPSSADGPPPVGLGSFGRFWEALPKQVRLGSSKNEAQRTFLGMRISRAQFRRLMRWVAEMDCAMKFYEKDGTPVGPVDILLGWWRFRDSDDVSMVEAVY